MTSFRHWTVLALLSLAPMRAEADVIYQYDGHRITDLTFLQPKMAPFEGLDQVTGRVVLSEPLPDRTTGFPSGLEGFQALAWSFTIGDALTMASDMPGASLSLQLSTFGGHIFAWNVNVGITGWAMHSWEFSETISSSDGATNARFDIPGASWSGPQPFPSQVPEPVGLVSLAVFAGAAYLRRRHRRT